MSSTLRPGTPPELSTESRSRLWAPVSGMTCPSGDHRARLATLEHPGPRAASPLWGAAPSSEPSRGRRKVRMTFEPLVMLPFDVGAYHIPSGCRSAGRHRQFDDGAARSWAAARRGERGLALMRVQGQCAAVTCWHRYCFMDRDMFSSYLAQASRWFLCRTSIRGIPPAMDGDPI